VNSRGENKTGFKITAAERKVKFDYTEFQNVFARIWFWSFSFCMGSGKFGTFPKFLGVFML
jgi:hypothetical protein